MSGQTVLENEKIRVTVSAHGAELCGIFDKTRGHEVIWQADPKYWNRHAPVLFPFVGKVNGGYYKYRGVSYPMGQHGFARDMEFTKTAEGNDFVTYELRDDDQSRERYPFAFLLRITHRIEENRVIISWEVENPSTDEPLYFSIGGHPAFNCPADAGEKKTDYSIRFPEKKMLRYILIDPGTEGADAGNPQTLSLSEDGRLQVTDHLFDRDAFIFDGGQVDVVGLCYPDSSPYVTMDLTGFPSLGVWSKPHSDAPYICLEPWIGRVDNMGFDGELPEKYGEQHLAPGEQFHASYSITVE